MKAVLYHYIGVGANDKAKYERIILAEDPAYLALQEIGEDEVKIIRKGPKVVAVAKLSEHDYVKLE